MSSPPTYYSSVFAFNHDMKALWTNADNCPDDASRAILLVDVSGSMEKHASEARVALSAICCTSNLKSSDLKVPPPAGGTAPVDAVSSLPSKLESLGIDKGFDRLVILTDGQDLHSTCEFYGDPQYRENGDLWQRAAAASASQPTR